MYTRRSHCIPNKKHVRSLPDKQPERELEGGSNAAPPRRRDCKHGQTHTITSQNYIARLDEHAIPSVMRPHPGPSLPRSILEELDAASGAQACCLLSNIFDVFIR